MDCRTVDRAIQDMLDGPTTSDALTAHVQTCSACAARLEGFMRLQAALRTIRPPAAPERLADRVLAEFQAEPVLRIERRPDPAPIPWRRLAAAALVLAGSLIGLRSAWRSGPARDPEVVNRPEGSPPLSESLAMATSATIQLAQATSEPAARLGRLLLATGVGGDSSDESRLEPPVDERFLRSFSGRVATEIEPITGSARRAFGFLLPSQRPKPADLPPTGPVRPFPQGA